jgi:alcohol dehydrogenase
MKMRAAVLYEMGLPPPYAKSKPIRIEEVELDPPGEGECLVRIMAAGLCHSDLSVVNGDRPRTMPIVVGHEAAGEIVEAGKGVKEFKPGDHVAMVFVPSCGECIPCSEGRPALCEPGVAANVAGTLLSGHRRMRKGSTILNHQVGVSVYAEYSVCSRHSLVKIDKAVAWDEAALFGCAVITGAGAVINTGQVKAGQSVAIVGLGGVGLSAMLAARMAGAREVIGIDTLDHKLKLARQLGATKVFNASDPGCVDAVREATKGGVDVALEFASSTEAFALAYKITRRGGTTVTASLPNPAHTFSLPVAHMVVEERVVKGSYIGSSVPKRDIPRFIELYQQGLLPIDRLLSERIKFEDLNVGFDRLAAGDVVRQILIP